MIVRVSDKSFDIKTLSKSCLADPKSITLGFVVRKSQPAKHSKRYKLFKEKIFLRLYSTADVIFGNYKSHRYSPTMGHHQYQILSHRFFNMYTDPCQLRFTCLSSCSWLGGLSVSGRFCLSLLFDSQSL